MKRLIFIGLIALFAFSSCKNKDSHDHEGHNHSTEEQHSSETGEIHTADDGHNHAAETDPSANNQESQSDEIVMTPEQAKAAGVVVTTIQPSAFRQVIPTSGQVLVAQGDESVAVATVAGIVNFNGQMTQGKSVSKGSSLLTISSGNLADGDPVLRAKITYETAKQEYDRMAALVESQIVSQSEFAQAKQNYESARISYEALANENTPKGQAIPAPISGYIKNILVNEGDYVTVGQPLMSVTQNRKLFLRADVAEKYYSVLNTIRSANFQTPYDKKVYELDAMQGKLLSTGKAAETNSFFVPVTFEFNNLGDIVPGSYVEIFLLGNPMENVIALPRTAITEQQGLYFVYIQIDEEGYRRQEVTLGADDGVNVQILSGVKAGDPVVTQGAYQIRLASVSAALPSHNHEH